MKRRITNEFKDLSSIFSAQNILISNDDENNNVIINATINYNNRNEKYTFILNKKYPFHAPTIQFNNKPYSHYLRLPSQRFSEYLQFFINKKCLCCSSLDCKYNWSPSIKITMIINEINKNRKYKRDIVYKILSDQIKYKYLIDDIHIDAFLFSQPLLRPGLL